MFYIFYGLLLLNSGALFFARIFIAKIKLSETNPYYAY